MKKWPETASEVHEALMAGVFVGWRADGSHNSSVSFDMLLEQTYTADAKEASVLDGITLSPCLCRAQVYAPPPPLQPTPCQQWTLTHLQWPHHPCSTYLQDSVLIPQSSVLHVVHYSWRQANLYSMSARRSCTDLFQCQNRSETECPNCENVSKETSFMGYDSD